MAYVDLALPGRDDLIPITIGRARMQRLAKHWHYVLRSRRRWIDDQTVRAEIEQRAVTHLEAIGVRAENVAQLAKASMVQVNIEHRPEESETQGQGGGLWEARLVPWEYLLTAATSRLREDRLLVVRHLTGVPAAVPLPASLVRAKFLDSAPGRLRGVMEFDIEFRVMHGHLRGMKCTRLRNPTLAEIQSMMLTGDAPDLLHISGLDSFQGFQKLNSQAERSADRASTDGARSVTEIQDGIYLKGDNGVETPVDALALANSMTCGARKPTIVTFNLYNSSARLAAFAVAGGVHAAIGFQDVIDDRVAEIFYASFFWNLQGSPHNLLTAFRQAITEADTYADEMRGTGIVLWSGAPLTSHATPSPTEVPATCEAERASHVRQVAVATMVVPYAELNYSILQNNKQAMFETFSIYRYDHTKIDDLLVEVELQTGSERFPYRRTFCMPHHVLDLRNKIAVSLTSNLVRSLREGVQATLYVNISCSAQPNVLCATYPVILLPIDEWRDDDANRRWLPSFILPRDTVVFDVITEAQRYLMSLRDDPFAGFDGYQGIDQVGDDTDAVISQVRAIWYALLHQYRLRYISPPPVFTRFSQRLRTPSDILRGGRGTCIDLTLLFAACLEFIDMRPVIFLLLGHAFVGVWADETRRQEFLAHREPAPLMPATGEPTPQPGEDDNGPNQTDGVRGRLEVEAGLLGGRIRQGLAHRERSFVSWTTARGSGVTPLTRADRTSSMASNKSPLLTASIPCFTASQNPPRLVRNVVSIGIRSPRWTASTTSA